MTFQVLNDSRRAVFNGILLELGPKTLVVHDTDGATVFDIDRVAGTIDGVLADIKLLTIVRSGAFAPVADAVYDWLGRNYFAI